MTHNVIITGCARSGTTYMAALLNALGIDAVHEPSGVWPWTPHPQLDRLDVSKTIVAWQAAPHTHYLRAQGWKVLHLVRDPIKVIQSLQHTDFLTPNASDRYTDYAMSHMPEASKYLDGGDMLRAAIIYATRWDSQTTIDNDGVICVDQTSYEGVAEILTGVYRRFIAPSDVKAESITLGCDMNSKRRVGLRLWTEQTIMDTPISWMIRERKHRYAYT